MSRRVLATVLALMLGLTGAGCVSLPRLRLPRPAPVAAAAPVGPLCPGALMAELVASPAIPPDAGFPSPSTDAERRAVSSYLEWLHAYAVWGRAGWSRAADARAFCTGR